MRMNKLLGKNAGKNALTVLFSAISIVYIMPVLAVVLNSFKLNTFVKTNTFDLPNAESFAGFANFIKGMTFGNYPFANSVLYSIIITILSTALILLFTSMAAWYIARRDSGICKTVYYLCVFSMVVPFQMVMFTMSKMANILHLDNPIGIILVYIGFGCGMSTFMFAGFMKSIPLEVEEASMIDGCSPLQTYFKVVLPILKPTMISVGILETMWVWNDYLLPTLVLDIKKYRTIPMLIQYFRGSYGRVEMGPMMACIVMTVLPVVIIYLLGQKHIIKGVLAGAVKG